MTIFAQVIGYNDIEVVSLNKKILILSIVFNIVFLSMACVVVCRKGGITYIINRITTTVGASESQPITSDPYYKNRTDLFKSLPISDNATIFLGDSITDGCEWSELLQNQNIKNRGISSDTTYGVLNRLDNVIKSNPNKVFLMIGINDISNGVAIQEIISNYDKILGKITKELPNTKIFVQSILPINGIIYNANKNLTNNEKVIICNKEIHLLSEKYNLSYIDLYSLMSYQDQLNINLTNDGVHLNDKGYNFWKDAISKYTNQ